MTTTLVRLLATMTTVLACICLIMRHKTKIDWLNNYFVRDDVTHIFAQYHELIAGADRDIREGSASFLSGTLLMELLILIPLPIPWYD